MLPELGLCLRALMSPICFTDYLRLTITLLLFSFIISIIIRHVKNQLKLPPGPWGIPFLGSLPWMRHKAPHSWYVQLSDKYGELTSVKLGSNLLVCVGSARILRDIFNRPDSVNRPHTPLNDLMGGRGIVLSEGELWKKHRLFLHDKFRALGVNKIGNCQRFEMCVMVEVEEFLLKLEELRGVPVDPVMLLGRHVHNIICQLTMSFRFEEEDPTFKSFNERVSKGMKLYGAIHIGEHIPSYLYLPGKKAVLKEIERNLFDISEFHIKHVAARRRRLQNCDLDTYEPTDLLDYYLMKTEDKEGAKLFQGVDPDEQIVQVMNDLFSAGMETSRTTLVWLLVMMLREPAVAARVRSELEQILEPGEQVMLRHRVGLPYLEAVIFETLRIVSVVPLGTTHVNGSRWQIGDYVIPAGTHLVPLLNKINMDPEIFPNPDKFSPERFLVNGRLRIPDSFMPFGVGRRICLGEQLARIELFLFFANMMNSFEFALPEGHPMPALEGVVGITHAPLPYSLCFKKIEADCRDVQHG